MRIATILAAAVIAIPIMHARAQAPAAAVPEAMPFDIPYGSPINLETAQKAIAASEAEARKHNWKMSITVVDPAGNIVALATMDGTQYASIAIAEAKARTAAAYRRPSGVFQSAVNSGGAPSMLGLLAVTGSIPSEGGFPIVVGGKLIGAIGASGGIFTQDAVTAKAGLAVAEGK